MIRIIRVFLSITFMVLCTMIAELLSVGYAQLWGVYGIGFLLIFCWDRWLYDTAFLFHDKPSISFDKFMLLGVVVSALILVVFVFSAYREGLI